VDEGEYFRPWVLAKVAGGGKIALEKTASEGSVAGFSGGDMDFADGCHRGVAHTLPPFGFRSTSADTPIFDTVPS
jgi:hypothetical protein